MMLRFITRLAVTVLVLLAAVPGTAAADITQDDLEQARAKVREVSSRLEEEAIRYEDAFQEETRLRDELDSLVVDLAVFEQELAEARVAARDRLLEMYMAGTEDPALVGVFESKSFEELPARIGYMDSVADADRQTINRLRSVRTSYLDQQELVEEALSEQEGVRAELDALAATISEEMAAVDAEYRQLVEEYEEQERRRREEEERRRREEEERRRREEEQRRAAEAAAAAATSTTVAGDDSGDGGSAGDGSGDGGSGEGSSGEDASAEETTTTTEPPTTTTEPPPPPPANSNGRTCPVDGPHTFTDTWGANRGGGRSHQGVDMMAPRGTRLVAAESGVIGNLKVGNLQGNGLWVYGTSGDHFFYAHLDGFASGIGNGTRVSAGQLIGYVGSTGNASYSAPHLHFEYHPGGRGAVNPTPLVNSLCR